MASIEIITRIETMQQRADELRRDGKVIAFVPTMGYLHEGHLSLIREARRHGDIVVISIFVNPAQFAPEEDFGEYPRALERDIELAEKEGVGIVFAPQSDRQMYPEGFQSYVELTALPQHLCGLSRPIFFRGVATVVTKLFNIVKPHVAVFGQKDFQQLTVIRRMARDLNVPVEIIGAPTVREPDGLAMSSRNAYLTDGQRTSALTLSQSLRQAQRVVADGETDAARVIEAATALISSRPDTEIDYIAVCDPETLDNVPVIDKPVVMALAVKVGSTRLIDNMLLTP